MHPHKQSSPQSAGCRNDPTLWTDAEKLKYAREFIEWVIQGFDELDIEDWWSEDHDGERYWESDMTDVVTLLRTSKIIIKPGR